MPDSMQSFGEPMAPEVTITSRSQRRSRLPPLVDDLDADRAAVLDDDAGDQRAGPDGEVLAVRDRLR